MRTNPYLHWLRMFIMLALLWLLLSGYFHTLMLAFGAISVAIVVWLSHRMDKVDRDDYTLQITPNVLLFILKLGKRIIISNIDVTLHVLGFKRPASQFVTLPVPFKDDLSKVIYANAITLTPGSASITLEQDTLIVHTISDQGAKDLMDGDMLGIMPTLPATGKQDKLS